MSADELVKLGVVALQKQRALGSIGPDKITLGNLGNKLNPVDQGNLLGGHGDMKIPTQTLFDQIYKKWIINKENGIKNFGKWNIN